MAYAADLLTVSTGGIRSVCMLLDELSSTSTISATIEASPPLCIIITNYVTFKGKNSSNAIQNSLH